MLNHITPNSSRLQTISASTNCITPFLDLKKRNPFYYNIKINNHNNNDYDQNENVQCNINERTISLASLVSNHLRVSTLSLLEFATSSYRNDYDFLNAFGILKSVPSPSSNKIFSNKERYILFNPPRPKPNKLDEQYYINKHKFGDKKANKNDFIIMSTVFIFDYVNENIEL
jgi:hypothetical protein